MLKGVKAFTMHQNERSRSPEYAVLHAKKEKFDLAQWIRRVSRRRPAKKNRSLQTDSCSVLTLHKKELRDDFGNNASTNSTATFTDREAQTFFHGYRVDQGSDEVDVVTRHYHFNAFVQFHGTSYVSGTEVELWKQKKDKKRTPTFLVENLWVSYSPHPYQENIGHPFS